MTKSPVPNPQSPIHNPNPNPKLGHRSLGFGHFDPDRALAHARAIARPRLVGTPGEAFVAEYVANVFRAAGLVVHEEPFEFSAGWETVQRGFLLLIVLVLSATYWVRPAVPALAAILGLLAAALLLAYNPVTHRIFAHCVLPEGSKPGWLARLVFRIGPQLRARNIVARFPPFDSSPARPVLYLIAHYDSKSQNLTLVQRARLVMILGLGGIGFGVMSLVAGLWPDLVHITWFGGPYATLYILATVAALLLLGLQTGNYSPGAIDNASGVGMLLHMAEWLAQNPALVQRLDVTCVAMGAEEWGLMGSFAFEKAHRLALADQARRSGLYVLNFDGPGVDGPVYATASLGLGTRRHSLLLDLIRAAGQHCNLDVRVANTVLGLMADHFPFVMAGLDGVTLATVGPASWSVHSARDTIEKLDPRGIERVGRVACEVLHRLATDTY